MAKPAYATPGYLKARKAVLADNPICVHCGAPGTESDHQPPLSQHAHIDGTDCCRLVPSCFKCGRKQGGRLGGHRLVRMTATTPRPAKPAPMLDAVGYGVDDPVWNVSWLDEFGDIPAEATWPRLMSPPHPRAVGSWGAEVARQCVDRLGEPLYWWQRLAATRILEHDTEGNLVWDNVGLTVARQVGKSHLLRELCLWRLHQGRRYGRRQRIVHTGMDQAICVEVQGEVRRWARAERFKNTYKVRDANGSESIELLADGSKWVVKAQTGVYGQSASFAVVDEGWKIEAAVIEEGLVPTMIAERSPQLLLVSTAHRKAKALMMTRRNTAIGDLAGNDGLWLEWSASPLTDIDDVAGWRQASPQWTQLREKMIAGHLRRARAGEVRDDEEDDPIEWFAAQWLNRWPTTIRASGHGEPLLEPGTWATCEGRLDSIAGPVVIAVEFDNSYEAGGAAALAAGDGQGRFELDGAAFDTFSAAVAKAAEYAALFPQAVVIRGALVTDAQMDPIPNGRSARRAGSSERTRALMLLRSLVSERRVVHDDTRQLDEQFAAAKVVRLNNGGLSIVTPKDRRRDLANAALLALEAAQRGQPRPAVH